MAKIDVIIPTYNRFPLLARALSSVVKQSYPHWRLLVVDDGSTDQTRNLVAEWAAKDARISYIWQPNRGVSAARNLGIKSSDSEFIAFLDSDDEWLPHKLQNQMQFLAAHPQLPLVHTEEIWFRRGVRVNPKKKHGKSGGRIFTQCLLLCCISPSAVLLRRQLLAEVGLFAEEFVVCEDYELWLRICSRYEVGFMAEPQLIKHGGHDSQLSHRYKAMDYFRLAALLRHRQSGYLHDEEREMLENTIAAKRHVLLRGYRKHENLVNYDAVFSATKGRVMINSVLQASSL